MCCGWSHTVLRGVRPDGSIACAAWGRRDLGQYPLEDNRAVDSAGVPRKNGATGGDSLGESGLRGPPGTQGAEHRAPQMLSLPHGLRIREVWAGSEFTVAADEKGDLWACGWNEHGNLGRGGLLAFESSARWVKVVTSTHRGTAAGADERIEREPEVMGSSRSQGTGPGSAVTHEQHVRLSTVWEGALACGGGHVLCLTHAILDRDT